MGILIVFKKKKSISDNNRYIIKEDNRVKK